jgi:hypothetical protein
MDDIIFIDESSIICTTCKCEFGESNFVGNAGRLLKTCSRCRRKQKETRDRNKCPHGKRKAECKECDGASICEHGKRISRCVKCGGASICIHGIHKQNCKECGGSSICIHDKYKRSCKICTDPTTVIINQWIFNSKAADIKSNKYDPENFITLQWLNVKMEEYKSINYQCHTCNISMCLTESSPKLITIERLDNTIGHIKGNCVFACFGCNRKHQGFN